MYNTSVYSAIINTKKFYAIVFLLLVKKDLLLQKKFINWSGCDRVIVFFFLEYSNIYRREHKENLKKDNIVIKIPLIYSYASLPMLKTKLHL